MAKETMTMTPNERFAYCMHQAASSEGNRLEKDRWFELALELAERYPHLGHILDRELDLPENNWWQDFYRMAWARVKALFRCGNSGLEDCHAKALGP